MKLKGKKYIAPILLLIAVILAMGLLAGCTSGAVSMGWSGGVVSGQYLYIGSNAGRLVSINLSDDSILRGEQVKVPASGSILSCGCNSGSQSVPIYGTPLVTENAVYMAAYNGKVYSYRADNLAQRWIFPANGYIKSIVSAIVTYDEVLYFGCSDGNIYALDANTGELITKTKAGDKVWGTPAIDPVTKTLFVGSYDKKLYAFSLDKLSLKWTYDTKGSIIATPLIYNGTVYFGSFDRNFYAVDAATGALKWQFRGTNWFWSQPLLFNGALYVGCMDHNVYVLNPATGKATHEPYNLKSGVASSPIVVDNLIVFVSQKGVIYKLDTGTMKMDTITDLKINVNGQVMAYNGIVYIHPQSMQLIRVNPANGSVLPAITL